MLNASSIMEALNRAGVGVSRSADQRLGNALGPQGMGQSGGLMEQLGSLLGQSGGPGGKSGGLSDFLSQLGNAARDGASRTTDAVKRNDPLAVGGIGALAGALLGGRSGAIGGGLMAVLGSVALAALKNAQAGSNAAAGIGSAEELPVTVRGAATPAEEEALNERSLLVVRAMISAAKADGHIDHAELQKITSKLEQSGVDQEAREWLMNELRSPIDVAGLAADIHSPELAAEIYAASLLAIEVDTEEERAYLHNLAAALQIHPEVAAHIHRTLGVA